MNNNMVTQRGHSAVHVLTILTIHKTSQCVLLFKSNFYDLKTDHILSNNYISATTFGVFVTGQLLSSYTRLVKLK